LKETFGKREMHRVKKKIYTLFIEANVLLTFPLARGTLIVAMSSLETDDTISGLPVIESATSP